MDGSQRDAYEGHLIQVLMHGKSQFVQLWERSEVLNPRPIFPGLPLHKRTNLQLEAPPVPVVQEGSKPHAPEGGLSLPVSRMIVHARRKVQLGEAAER